MVRLDARRYSGETPRRAILIAFLLILALPPIRVPATVDAATVRYRIQELPLLVGGNYQLGGLNNGGQVAGVVLDSNGNQRAMRFEPDGTLTDLGMLPGGSASYAYGIADDGRVVGAATTRLPSGNLRVHPFVSGPSGLIDLCPTYEQNGFANAMNGSGIAVGGGCLPGMRATAMSGTNVTDLGVLGGSQSVASSINASGQIVGNSQPPNGSQDPNLRHAFLYENGTLIDLAPALGTTSASYAADINDATQIVGSASFAGGMRAFRYDHRTGAVLDLGVLPGAASSGAMSINNAGEIVGGSGGRAYLYRAGTMHDLNTFLPANSDWTLEAAYWNNDRGQILGWGSRNGGAQRPFLLTPATYYDLAVTVSGNGTVERSVAPGPYESGTGITLTARPDTDHQFVGWTVNGVATDTAATLPLTFNRDHEVIATFAPRQTPSPTPSPAATPTPSPAQASPQLTIGVVAGGTTEARPTAPYVAGQQVVLTAQAAPGQRFIGWQIAGVGGRTFGTAAPVATWTNPLPLTLSGDLTVIPVFVADGAFPDLAPTEPARKAILELTARGILRGYETGYVGPGDPILRGQQAALIARTHGYNDTRDNPFTDQCVPTDPGNCVDDEFWRAIAQLAARDIARGYSDSETCAPAAAPCYAPIDQVSRAQVISFITRAMIAGGYWRPLPADPTLTGGGLSGSDHESDFTTYLTYAGAQESFVRDLVALSMEDWHEPATRAWFAQALWLALDRTFGIAP